LWQYCQHMDIPDALAYKIRQFRGSGRVVRYGGDLFATSNWIAVFMGQDIWPQSYDTLMDQRDASQLQATLHRMRRSIRQAAEAGPRHEEFLARHCGVARR
jgi:tryptophan 7-halogenase